MTFSSGAAARDALPLSDAGQRCETDPMQIPNWQGAGVRLRGDACSEAEGVAVRTDSHEKATKLEKFNNSLQTPDAFRAL